MGLPSHTRSDWLASISNYGIRSDATRLVCFLECENHESTSVKRFAFSFEFRFII